MYSSVRGIPAGSSSIMQVKAGPCDSPAVRYLNNATTPTTIIANVISIMKFIAQDVNCVKKEAQLSFFLT
jgi:hypothetical protein